jgi:HSP20 family molecular chaperone IbpA
VEARYNNGILLVTLGKTEGGKSKRIEVKTA